MSKIIKTKKKIIHACYLVKEGHIASSFSVLNIINVLIKYCIFKKKKYLNNFIMSKGHAAIGYYAALNQYGYLSDRLLNKFATFNSPLGGHPKRNLKYFITASTGSLGHGLPIAAGMAFANKLMLKKKLFYILMGDQECNEGTIWESLLLCKHHGLNNLTIIIDRNFSREKDLSLGHLEKKLKPFSSKVFSIDGHNEKEIYKIFKIKNLSKEPKIIIANTIKGYGSKIIEEGNIWHHKFPQNTEEYNFIINSIKC
jgi:transketolase